MIRQARWLAPFLSLPSQSSMWAVSVSSPNRGNILDLSSTAGHSVNDRIAGEDYPLQYMKVDDIVGIMRLGQGSLTAKIDVQNAYRIVPVHTEDRQLLGMKWQGAFYVDMVQLSVSGQLHISSHL